MSPDEWAKNLASYEKQGRTAAEIREVAAYLEARGPRKPRERRTSPVARERDGSVRGGGKEGMIAGSDYVASDVESRHLVRDESGAPMLRLVDAGDRLAIWSPAEGGALINPKSAGLRAFGLVQTICRGGQYFAAEYKAADLRKGRTVDLGREPDNPHDKNAVALLDPGGRRKIGYIQRGYAGAVARRLDAGEQLTAICLWGPGPRRDDNTTRLLIGTLADLAALQRSD